jgi:glutamine synthetase
MPGTMTFDALKTAVANGEIDTVLVAGIDMQGRLVGKRFHAAVLRRRRLGRDPLLQLSSAVDMEMTTVQGYQAHRTGRAAMAIMC